MYVCVLKFYRLSVYPVSYQCQRPLILVRYHYLVNFTLNYILGHYGLIALQYMHSLWSSDGIMDTLITHKTLFGINYVHNDVIDIEMYVGKY